MKATYNEKEVLKNAMRSIADTTLKFGDVLIDEGMITLDMNPVDAFQLAVEIAGAKMLESYNQLTEEQLKKVSEEVTAKYTKIDYGKKDE